MFIKTDINYRTFQYILHCMITFNLHSAIGIGQYIFSGDETCVALSTTPRPMQNNYINVYFDITCYSNKAVMFGMFTCDNRYVLQWSLFATHLGFLQLIHGMAFWTHLYYFA